MTIRKELESKILAKLRALVGNIATVSGLLESVAAGSAKEIAKGRPEVRVTVAPAQAGGWGKPEVEFSVKVNVRLDLEDDVSQASFDAVCEPIENLIESWQLDRNWREVSDDLGISRFRIDGFRADGGRDSVSFTASDPYLSTDFAFALQGVLRNQKKEES